MTKIEIYVTTTSPHTERVQQMVMVEGAGSVEHYVDTIRAALVAAGHAPETAARVRYCEADE